MGEHIITIILAIFASTGFWAFVTTVIQKNDAKLSSRDKILMGLANERICSLAEGYLKEGSISDNDYKCLNDYLYVPYKHLGGNGSAEKIMNEVKNLPLKKED